MDFSIITIIIQLVFLECILSIDNAAVLGAMVAPLPNDKGVPWPARFARTFRVLDPLLGDQRQAALKVGLLGAYVGRISMILLASLIIQNVWLHIIGAVYLIYLAVHYFGEAHKEAHDSEEQRPVARRGGFWHTVLLIELADLAFSLDNVIAAVALSDRLWVVILGIALGMVLMRFAATMFTTLIGWEPKLEAAAYLLLLAIGGKLLLEEYTGIEVGEWTQFGLSILLIALVVLFARVPLLHRLAIVFRPFGVLCALINRAIAFVGGLLALPFQHAREHASQNSK